MSNFRAFQVLIVAKNQDFSVPVGTLIYNTVGLCSHSVTVDVGHNWIGRGLGYVRTKDDPDSSIP